MQLLMMGHVICLVVMIQNYIEYDENVTQSNGSCSELVILGCMDDQHVILIVKMYLMVHVLIQNYIRIVKVHV